MPFRYFASEGFFPKMITQKINKKRGQITIFAVIGVVIILIVIVAFGLFPSIKKQISTEKTEFKDIVKSYAETCLTMISRTALRDLMGMQGGYINSTGDEKYGEGGVDGDIAYGVPGTQSSKINPPKTTIFNGDNVPYYLEANCYETHCHQWSVCCSGDPPSCSPCPPCIDLRCHWYLEDANGNLIYPIDDATPDLIKINQTFANYIAVEFEKCFDVSVFEELGINVTKPIVNYIKVDIGLNEEDTAIKLTYPITIKKEGIEIKLDTFRVTLPIRFKALYSSALELVGKIVDQTKVKETPAFAKFPYVLTEGDCSSFNKNSLTNLFIKPFEAEPHEIAQFVDYSNFYEGYPPKSYFFQFAVKNVKFVDGQGNPKDRCYP